MLVGGSVIGIVIPTCAAANSNPAAPTGRSGRRIHPPMGRLAQLCRLSRLRSKPPWTPPWRCGSHRRRPAPTPRPPRRSTRWHPTPPQPPPPNTGGVTSCGSKRRARKKKKDLHPRFWRWFSRGNHGLSIYLCWCIPGWYKKSFVGHGSVQYRSTCGD